MIEKLREMSRNPMEQVEFLIYVLSAGAIALFMSLFDPPWWVYFPPVILLGYAGWGRYTTLRQTPGKHRKST